MLLKRFEVENFRGFDGRLIFDLTAGRFDFNPSVSVDGFVKNAIIYGPNGIGKSALGFALFDVVVHLTDKLSNDQRVQVIPYCNLNTDSNVALFKYCFQWGDSEIVYEYGKTDPITLSWERLSVNGDRIIEYDFTGKTPAYIREGLAGSLNMSLPDGKLSILKYIYRNTPTDTVPAISRVVQFCENMLWYRSLSKGNQFTGHDTTPAKLTEMLLRDGKTIDDFSKFLEKFGLFYKLGLELVNGDPTLFAYFKDGKKADFYSIASTGTMALYLFYCWSVSAFSDVSLLFIDEFDAFLHYEASAEIVTRLNKTKSFQSILTTHNTSLLSNVLTRPDCSFLMYRKEDNQIAMSCLSKCTDREIRQVHNLEKMYRAGAFAYHA